VPSAVPPSFGCAALFDRRSGLMATRLALPCIAGALRRSLLGSPCCRAWLAVRSGGSRVHSLPLSLRFAPATGSLCRRPTGTRPVHSPFFVMWRGVWARAPRSVKRGGLRGQASPRGQFSSARRGSTRPRTRRTRSPATVDIWGIARPSATDHRARSWIRDGSGWLGRADSGYIVRLRREVVLGRSPSAGPWALDAVRRRHRQP
jgi:hypothetical protein